MENTSDIMAVMTTTGDMHNAEMEDHVNMEMAKNMHFVSSAIVGPIFALIGIIGNILSIIVWMRPKMRSSTGTYLIGQAIADMGLLIFFFLVDSLQQIAPEVKTSSAYGFFFCYIGFPMFFLLIACSIWFTVGVTTDRYIHVCWISHAKDMCTVKRAITALGIITFLCFVINAPHYATFETISDSERTPADAAFRPTEYGAGELSKNYEFWVHCMFIVLAPVASIFVMNILIIHRVATMNRRMDSKRGESGKEKAKKSEAQMTRLLLTVTFTFLVLIVFQCIVQCFFMLEAGDTRIVSELYSVAKLGIVVNSSINFFLYCLSATRFRKELSAVVCTRIRGYTDYLSSYTMSDSTSSSALSRTKSGYSTKDSSIST